MNRDEILLKSSFASKSGNRKKTHHKKQGKKVMSLSYMALNSIGVISP